jgi:hypothetical protein
MDLPHCLLKTTLFLLRKTKTTYAGLQKNTHFSDLNVIAEILKKYINPLIRISAITTARTIDGRKPTRCIILIFTTQAAYMALGKQAQLRLCQWANILSVHLNKAITKIAVVTEGTHAQITAQPGRIIIETTKHGIPLNKIQSHIYGALATQFNRK